ncbi:hypothetical protein [Parerythrobacter lacustris]|uniref:Uncharacterized protein n=1 Tax=Parerythrobacter lacustris TaxID=2969984 RepID=A0ABT1XL65_9SPHN|nr:hypothetical protein [Parerythrobacter lacustris]MCR2832399.1 hypothetical protein [Parerythrobacter lacustris]
MTSTRLLFDVSGLDLVDAIQGIGWRLDPVRREAEGSDEDVVEIAVQNADKVVFAQETAATISEIAKVDKNEATAWALENFHILLVALLRTMLSQNYKGKITMNPKRNQIRGFLRVDILDDLKQYETMKKKIENIEGTESSIRRGTKSVMNDTLTPLFTHLSAGISKIGKKSDKEFSDIKGILKEIRSDLKGMRAK